jgi:competence protein CoiA
MKYSLVNGERREAEKGLSGICIGCEQPMVPKCGLVKVKHWAHKSKCKCDHWWENETEWHRNWKDHFPDECQEVRLRAENGEWHFADVRTAQGWVLEFQNSPISDEERDARNAFYRTIVWVVNGSRLKRDRDRFFKTIENGIKICDNPQVIKIFLSESSLVEKWSKSKAPVFFDFGDESLLWCLYPTNSNQWGFVSPIKKVDFISFHQGEENQLKRFLEFLQVFNNVILSYFFQIQRQQQIDLQRQILMRPQSNFQRYLARQRSRRRL